MLDQAFRNRHADLCVVAIWEERGKELARQRLEAALELRSALERELRAGAGAVDAEGPGGASDAVSCAKPYIITTSATKEEFAAWKLTSVDMYRSFLKENASIVGSGF